MYARNVAVAERNMLRLYRTETTLPISVFYVNTKPIYNQIEYKIYIIRNDLHHYDSKLPAVSFPQNEADMKTEQAILDT